MTKYIRKIRSVTTKDGIEWATNKDTAVLLTAEGVEVQDDGGWSMYTWDEISELKI